VAGVATLIGTYGTKGTRTFTSPGTALALVLDDASLGFKAPGSSNAIFGGPVGLDPPQPRPSPHKRG